MTELTETLPMTVTAAASHAADAPPRPSFVRRVLLESGYALSAFVIALPAFVLAVTLMSVGIATIIIVGGVLVITLAVMVARGFARFERLRMRSMLGREAPTPAYLCARRGDGFWRRMLTPLRDPQSWLDVVWSVVGLVTGLVAFTLVVAWYAAAASGLTYWFWQQWLPDDETTTTLAELIGLGSGRGPEIALQFAIGVFALVTLPWVARLAATCHASLASVLLCSRAELQQEVARVEGGRDAARVAEAASLRRLERDIHDGPQQRLVRLSMDLGRARKQLDQDPEQAAETLDAALLQARETVEELRSLSRGIAPPLLVDRGLRAALGELMVRSEIPVESIVRVPDELPPHVETAVYFVVAEAMTNIAKHSHATRASATVTAEEDVTVRVEDDGVGGAHLGKGQGLAGLQQRLAGVDGRLDLDSPEGGPTVLVATIALGTR